MFVNAVDDPANATAYLGGVVRRDGVTLAISTERRRAGARRRLLREATRRPAAARDLALWMSEAVRQRRTLAARRRADGAAAAAAARGAERALPRRVPRRATTTDGRRGHRSRGSTRPRTHGCDGARLARRRRSRRSRAADAQGGRPACARADLVLYDALVDDADPRSRAARAAVLRRQARRPARDDARTAIHALMIRAARRGRRVVRLKGGDPFVFGRGGEEALALARGRRAVRGRAGRDERRSPRRRSRASRSRIAASRPAFLVVERARRATRSRRRSPACRRTA